MFMLTLFLASAIFTPTFEDRLLAVHNAERARLNQTPLIWEQALAKEAAIWANALASSRRFEHAQQSKHGENLWMGTRSAYSIEEMAGYWIDERKSYKQGQFPNVSRTGK